MVGVSAHLNILFINTKLEFHLDLSLNKDFKCNKNVHFD